MGLSITGYQLLVVYKTLSTLWVLYNNNRNLNNNHTHIPNTIIISHDYTPQTLLSILIVKGDAMLFQGLSGMQKCTISNCFKDGA